MKITTTFLLVTAATMIGTTAVVAQGTATTTTPPVTEQSVLDALERLFADNRTPSETAIRDALDGFTINRLRYDDDGEVRIRAVTPDGESIRIRVEDGQVLYRVGLFGSTSDANGSSTSSTSDANDDSNGGDTSGTSDSNDDSNGGDTSGTSDSNDDSNGGSTSGTSDSNDDNGGSTGGGSDDD